MNLQPGAARLGGRWAGSEVWAVPSTGRSVGRGTAAVLPVVLK
jgi:hypothetical protein